MTRVVRRHHGAGLGAIAAAFVAGIVADSLVRVYGPPTPPGYARGVAAAVLPANPKRAREPAVAPVATSGESVRLHMPIEGIKPETLKGGFAEARTGHPHEAVDILAPRNTPIHAVEEGTIAKLFVSKAGGNTIYEFDPTGRYAYYYAHLERYEAGLKEGETIERGQVIGYVGTSGNAPPNTPHLHFAVFELGPERRWWKGRAVDPYPFFQ